jgi:HK97 family phage major capsid protein
MDIKKLLEQRNNKMTQLEEIVNKAKEEVRGMAEDEVTSFEKIKAEIDALDKTIKADSEARSLTKDENGLLRVNTTDEQRALDEAEDKMGRFIRGETRALDVGGNASIIPTLISDRVLLKIKELSPIYEMSTKFNIGGDLVFPKLDPLSLTTNYVADGSPLTPANGNFTSVKLQNFIAGSYVQISRSLMNRTDFSVVDYMVNSISASVANFMERELLTGIGTTALTGIFVDTGAISVTAGSATALTLDDLISTQLSLPSQFQNGASWIMNKSTFAYLRKLKDTTGMPLLLQNSSSVQQGFGWTLLGSPVYVSANAPSTMTAGLKILAYGDFSGLYVKLAQNLEIQMLNELLAVNHQIGAIAYIEADSKIVEDQKIAVLKML